MSPSAARGPPARIDVAGADPRGRVIVSCHESGDDSRFSEFRVGLDHLALSVDSRDELEQWVDHLDRCGVPHSGISDMPYGSVVVLRDPDNIQLELFALATDFRVDLV